MAVAEASPSFDILVREPEGFSLWSGPPSSKGQPDVKLERVFCTSTIFSEDGSKLMAVTSDSVITIYDTETWKKIRFFEVPSLLGAFLSPRGTYLQTFQKPSSSQDKNVNLWKIGTGVSVYQLSQKNMTKSTWPSIRFSSDEAVACRMVTNEIQFFDEDFSMGYTHRLKIPGVSAFELTKDPGSHIATYISETKGIPASIQIYACAKDLQSQPVARRSFFRSSSVQFIWNNGSTGLLALVHSDDDKTNQSYYGESKLHYLTIDGSHEGLVPLNKEGPVHDARWSSSGSEFAVVYGFMPAKATIFNRKCKPILELGTGPYNTVRWNPKGKFLCLAGFGNLPGDMVFWDYSEKKQIGATKAEWSVTSEWSPDGRYFLTSTTAPRLQVDNRIKIFHHNGKLIFKKNFPKLYQAEWRPESADKFGDIAELTTSLDSLKVEDTKLQGSKSSQASASKSTSTVKAPSIHKPAAYRPPHAKAADAVQDQLFGRSSTPEMSKNALRNKKKREKQREKKAAEGSSDA